MQVVSGSRRVCIISPRHGSGGVDGGSFTAHYAAHNSIHSLALAGGAYCNGKKITVGTASDIGQLVVMNNIGACRDLNFLHHSVAMIQKLLEAKVSPKSI